MRRPLVVLASVAILVGACAAPSPGPTAASPAAQATAAPKRGGTVVIAATTDPGHFNSAITTAGGTHFVAGSLYNGLVALDEKGDPQPDLAEKWAISDGGRTYTFTLRSGVKWHDGKDFTSADVKFSFEQVLLKFHARTKAGLEGVLAGIDAPSANTVVFRFKQPYGPLLQRLDNIEAPIVAKHIYEGTDPTTAAANLKPIGTGPFKLADYVKSDTVRFVRNDAYFKPGRAVIFDPLTRKVSWEYFVKDGDKALDHSSIARELPDTGDILVVDDLNDRVMVIDRKTKEITWQYGKKGHTPGLLNYPDGFDIDVFRDWKTARRK